MARRRTITDDNQKDNLNDQENEIDVETDDNEQENTTNSHKEETEQEVITENQSIEVDDNKTSETIIEQKPEPEIKKEPVVEVKKESEFSNLTEMFEEKRYRIRARNKIDAEKLLKKILQSQDEILSLNSVSKGYDALVLKFIAREY